MGSLLVFALYTVFGATGVPIVQRAAGSGIWGGFGGEKGENKLSVGQAARVVTSTGNHEGSMVIDFIAD